MKDYLESCYRCGSGDAPTRPVRTRVPFKATVYCEWVSFWCAACRAKNNGRWKYAEPPILKALLAPNHLGVGI